MDHEAIRNAQTRIAEVQSALDEIQHILQAAERVQLTAEKGIRIMRPVAIATAVGLVLVSLAAGVRRMRRVRSEPAERESTT